MINYKTPLEILYENLENARKDKNDYLIENAEIEELLNYLKVIKNFMKDLVQSEHRAIHKLNDIQDICNGIPGDWTTCGISVIHKIEEVLNRDD